MESLVIEALRQKIAAAIREHERVLDEAIRQFNELSPEEQMHQQLLKWQMLLSEPRP